MKNVFTLLLLMLTAHTASAVVIGVEGFDYADGPIANQTGGYYWDWNNLNGNRTGTASNWDIPFGAPTVSGGRLQTTDDDVSREYNGPVEGNNPGDDEYNGSFNEGSVERAVYYKIEATTTGTLPAWLGVSSMDFGTAQMFWGVASGQTNFGISAGGFGNAPTVTTTTTLQTNTTYTLVAKLDFANDELALFINPDLSLSEASNTADASLPYIGTNWSTEFFLSSGNSAAEVYWDDLVIATTWSELSHGLIYNDLGTSIEITGIDSNASGDIYVPDSINGNPVTSIAASAFEDMTAITGIRLPNSITSIGERAFYNCTNLASMNIPTGLTSIPANFAWRCRNLPAITIPEGVTSIGDNAFFECTNLPSVTFPSTLTSIGGSAFQGCTQITSITLPAGFDSLGGFSFSFCFALSNINLPSGMTTIGAGAFRNTALTSVTIPDSVTTLGNGVFRECTSLQTAVLGSGVNTILSDMFRDCSDLSSVTLPSNITTISDNVFYGCSFLTDVTLPSNLQTIGNSVFRNSGLLTIALPDSVTSFGTEVFRDCISLFTAQFGNGMLGTSLTSIPSGTFQGCDNLSNLNFNGTLISIGDSAFQGTDISDFVIRGTVTSIGNDAFRDSVNLTTVYILGSPSIGADAFTNVAVDAYIGPFVADFGGDLFLADYNDDETVEIQLTASDLLAIPSLIDSYDWSWSGGTATGETAEFTFTQSDSPVSMTLTLTDIDGGQFTTTDTITIVDDAIAKGGIYESGTRQEGFNQIDMEAGRLLVGNGRLVRYWDVANGSSSFVEEIDPTDSYYDFGPFFTDDDTFFLYKRFSTNMGGPVSFNLVGNSWVEGNEITVDTVSWQNDPFVVASDGQRVAMGFPEDNSETGLVRVFNWTGDSWLLEQTITPPITIGTANTFGYSVDISGDYMLVTAYYLGDFIDNGFGQLFVYKFDGSTWNLDYEYSAPNPNLEFGESVKFEMTSADDGLAIVGAPRANNPSGSCFVFEVIDGVWSAQELPLPEYLDNRNLGFFVDLDADNRRLAATGEFASIAWEWVNSAWQAKLLPSLDANLFYDITVDGDEVVAMDGDFGELHTYDLATLPFDINTEPSVDAGNPIQALSQDGGNITVFIRANNPLDIDNDSLDFFWDWDGGSLNAEQGFISISPSVTSINLTVVDGRGLIFRDSVDVEVDVPPSVEINDDAFVVDTDGDGNVSIALSSTLTGGTNPIADYTWDWSGGVASGPTGIADFNLINSGTAVTLDVVDTDGLSDQQSFTVSLLSDDLNYQEIRPGEIIQFEGIGSDGIAIGDGRILIGSDNHEINGENTGTAFLFEKINNVWVESELIPSTIQDNGSYGDQVAFYEDYAFIASDRHNDEGAVFVFRKTGNNWVEQSTITAPDGAPSIRFGDIIKAANGWLMVGAPNADASEIAPDNFATSGAIYAFELDNGVWTYRTKFSVDDFGPFPATDFFAEFGDHISFDGNTLIATLDEYDEGSGTATRRIITYIPGPGFWNSSVVSEISVDLLGSSFFADFFEVSGDVLLFSHPLYDDPGSGFRTGAVLTYTRADEFSDWVEGTAILPSGNPLDNANQGFSQSFAFDGSKLAVTIPNIDLDGDPNFPEGAVEIFKMDGATATFQNRFSVPTGLSNLNDTQRLGDSLAIYGNSLLMSAPDSTQNNKVGAGKTVLLEDYVYFNDNVNYEPIAVADIQEGTTITDTIVRDEITDDITEPLGSEPVTLDGSGSTDQENAIVSYEWFWGDDLSTPMATGITVTDVRFPVGTTDITLRITDAGNVINEDTVSLTVNLSQATPDPLPSTTGNTLTVNLPSVDAVWRLTSEFGWHGDGEAAQDVVAGEVYSIEILPYPGSIEVIRTQVIPQSGAEVVDLSLLLPIRPTETGTIRFPETASGFSWRLIGENTWRDVTDNGDEFEDLLPATLPVGDYGIEFRPVEGFVTPAARLVTVTSIATQTLDWSGYQRIANFNSSNTFNVSSTTLADDPYQYIGMIRTPLGRGTGTVVAPSVVLTAAHLFFDFNGLAWNDVQWFGRQQQGERQAPPVTPRGILYRASYAELVAPDFLEGEVESLPEDAQEVDFAVLFFAAENWEQGEANFLQSTTEKNWLTGTESKIVAGYPQRSQPYVDKGKMFDRSFSTALSAIDTNTLPLLYQTTEVFGDGGASGSSLFVQPEGSANLYPAGVLLAGQSRAVFRVIDAEVTRMIRDGFDSANGAGDILDGSTNLVNNNPFGGGFTLISVNITPAPAEAVATWSITPNAGVGYGNIPSDDARAWISDWDSFTITFSAVSGYVTPEPIQINGALGSSTEYNAEYEAISGFDSFRQDNQLALDSSDTDGDFIPAIFEYAFDGNPDAADTVRPIQVKSNPSQSTFPEYELYISKDADAIQYRVLAADSLSDLASGTNVSLLGVFTKNDVSQSGFITVTDTQQRSASTQRFVWVEVEHIRALGDNANM